MSEIMQLHEDLDFMVAQCEKALERIKNRKFFVSEKVISKTIGEIDALLVISRKFI